MDIEKIFIDLKDSSLWGEKDKKFTFKCKLPIKIRLKEEIKKKNFADEYGIEVIVDALRDSKTLNLIKIEDQQPFVKSEECPNCKYRDGCPQKTIELKLQSDHLLHKTKICVLDLFEFEIPNPKYQEFSDLLDMNETEKIDTTKAKIKEVKPLDDDDFII
jgi:hypothetical protein